LLGAGPHFAGEQVTLADIMVGPQLDFLVATPEWQPLVAPVPNLVSWLARMNARESFKATTAERIAELAKAA
jgi:glutathione S-transferase